jgi:hypothetical protein
LIVTDQVVDPPWEVFERSPRGFVQDLASHDVHAHGCVVQANTGRRGIKGDRVTAAAGNEVDIVGRLAAVRLEGERQLRVGGAPGVLV